MSELYFGIKSKGIFTLDNEGATGKSYIGTLVNKTNVYKGYEYVRFITYDYRKSSSDYVQDIVSFNGEYLVLDRLDLYINSEVLNSIQSKDCCVLLDIKNTGWKRKFPHLSAKVCMSENVVQVVLN